MRGFSGRWSPVSSADSPDRCISLTVLKTGDYSEQCASDNQCQLRSETPDGAADYAYSLYSTNSCPQIDSIDHDGGPPATSSSSWRIGVSPGSASIRHRSQNNSAVTSGKFGPRKLCLSSEDRKRHNEEEEEREPCGTAREDKGLKCNAILADLFQQHPELHRALLLILEDERSSDNQFLGKKVQELFKHHKGVIAALNAELLTRTAKPNALRTTLFSRCTEVQTSNAELRSLALGNIQATFTSATQLIPDAEERHMPFFTTLVIMVVASLFFFMAGGYSVPGAGLTEKHPSDLHHWLSFRSHPDNTFNFNYLLLWGGQYLPAIHQHQGWRWITSAFIHTSFQHMLANMLLLATFGGMLEVRYGPWRISILACLSTLGAAFFAGMFADACSQVVGASGAVLGFVGLTVADVLINSGNLMRTFLRVILILAAVVFFIVTAATKAGQFTSNWSHLGGFICGLFPSFLFIPDFKDDRWKNAQRLRKVFAFKRHFSPRNAASSKTNSIENADGAAERDLRVTGDAQNGALEGRFEETQLNPTMPFACRTGEHIMDTAVDMESMHESHGGGLDMSPVQRSPQINRLSQTSGRNSAQSPIRTQETDHSLEDMDSARRTGDDYGAHFGHSEVKNGMKQWGVSILKRAFGAMKIHIIVGLLVLVTVFTVFPTYIYVHRLKHLSCPV